LPARRGAAGPAARNATNGQPHRAPPDPGDRADLGGVHHDPRRTRSASCSPSNGPNLNACPEVPAPTTIPSRRETMNDSSDVLSYGHTSTSTSSAAGNQRAIAARRLATATGSGAKSSSGSIVGPPWCTATL